MFPRPYPDELLGSTLIRACRHLGLSVTAAREAFGFPKSWQASLVSLQHVHRYCEVMDVPAPQLLNGHTVFPYVTAFWPADSVEEGLRRMLSREGSTAKSKTGTTAALVQSVTNHVSQKRLCPDCLRDDLALYGESYWHREHHLPATYLCLKHDRWLVETLVPAVKTRASDDYLLPQHAGRKSGRHRISKVLARQLTMHSLALLEQRPTENWFEMFRDLAASKGYQLSEKLYASVGMEEAMGRLFGRRLFEDLNLPAPDSKGRGGWASLFLRTSTRKEFIASTVKFVLLRTFLENCEPAAYSFQYPVPGRKTASRKSRDAKTARAIFRRMGEAEQSGERLHLKKLLIEIGAWSDFRHRRDLYPLTRAALQKLRESPVSVRPVRKSLKE